MNITLEKGDELNGTIKVHVEKNDYEEKVENQLKKQKRQAQIKGFRPGMAPMGLIRKLYGKAILFEEINTLVSESIQKYIQDEKLKILGDPLPIPLDINEEDENEEFTFSFEIGIAPEVDLEATKKSKIPFYIIKPDEKMIEGYIDNYRQQNGQFVAGEITSEDSMITGSITRFAEEASEEELQEPLEVKNASMLVKFVTDEEERNLFLGKRAGDTVIFKLPKAIDNTAEIASLLQIEREEASNIEGSFSFAIGEIKNFEKAPLNEELFKTVYGEEVKTEKEFREKIESDIKSNLLKESEGRFRIDAVDHIIEKTAIKLPEEFLKKWLLNVNEKLTSEEIDNEFEAFIKNMSWQIIRNKIAAENEIKITEEELLSEAINTTRHQFYQYRLYQVTDEQLENYAKEMLKQEEEARKIADTILSTKAIEWIKESAGTKEKKVSAEEFNKLFE